MDDAPASRDRADVEAWLAEREEAMAARVRDTLTSIVSPAIDAVAGSLVASVTADLSPIDGIPDAWFAESTELADDLTRTYLGGSMAAWLGVTDPNAATADMWMNVINQNAESFLAGATNRLKGIGDSVWTSVRARLQQSLAQGYTIDELREEVARTAQVAIGRAETIARTETMGAYINGDMGGMQALGAKGPVEKVWRATADARTRPSHVEASGQCVPFAANFTVGGVSMSHPHAAGAPADEVVNCRCYVEFLFPGDARPDGSVVEAPAPPPATRVTVAPAARPPSTPAAKPLKKLDGMDPDKEFQIIKRTTVDRLDMRLGQNQVMVIERLDDFGGPPLNGAIAYKRGGTTIVTELRGGADEWAWLRSHAKKLTYDSAMDRLGRADVTALLDATDAGNPDLLKLAKRITFREIPDPNNHVFTQQLGRPVTAAASASGRNVTFWNNGARGRALVKDADEILRHELGHVADSLANSGVTQSGSAMEKAWVEAMASDAAHARQVLLGPGSNGFKVLGNNARLGFTPTNPKGLTNYAQAAVTEDVAEAFGMFVNQGGLVTVKDKFGATRTLSFVDVFPARARLLSDMLAKALAKA